MGRTPCCEKVGLKKGPWTAEEDEKLTSYIAKHGHGSWRALPKKAGLLRCGKSCRLRWTNYLRPDIIRGEFSEAEEKIIIQLHALLGNRWSTIASHLPKRTDNEIKNYWNTHLKKRLLKMGIDPVTHKPKVDTLQQAAAATTVTRSSSCNSSLTSCATTNTSGSCINSSANLRGGRCSAAPSMSITASTAHMAQWENARLEAEARLVQQSKHLRANNKAAATAVLISSSWSHNNSSHAASSTSSRPPPAAPTPPNTYKITAAQPPLLTLADPSSSQSTPAVASLISSNTQQVAAQPDPNVWNNTATTQHPHPHEQAAKPGSTTFNLDLAQMTPNDSNKQPSWFWDKCLSKLTWVAAQTVGKASTENAAVNNNHDIKNNNTSITNSNIFTHINSNNNVAKSNSIKLQLHNNSAASAAAGNINNTSNNYHLTLLHIKKHLESQPAAAVGRPQTQSSRKDSQLPFLVLSDEHKTDLNAVANSNYTNINNNSTSLQDLSDHDDLFTNSNYCTAKRTAMNLNPQYSAGDHDNQNNSNYNDDNNGNDTPSAADCSITIPASITDLLNDTSIHFTASKLSDSLFGTLSSASQSAAAAMDGISAAINCTNNMNSCTGTDNEGASNNSVPFSSSLPLSLLCLQDLIDFDDPAAAAHYCNEPDNINAGAAAGCGSGSGAACSIMDEIERIIIVNNSSSSSSSYTEHTCANTATANNSKLSQKCMTHCTSSNNNHIVDNQQHHHQSPAEFTSYCSSMNALMDQDLNILF